MINETARYLLFLARVMSIRFFIINRLSTRSVSRLLEQILNCCNILLSHFGDNCIGSFHLGSHIVGYTVGYTFGNLILGDALAEP